MKGYLLPYCNVFRILGPVGGFLWRAIYHSCVRPHPVCLCYYTSFTCHIISPIPIPFSFFPFLSSSSGDWCGVWIDRIKNTNPPYAHMQCKSMQVNISISKRNGEVIQEPHATFRACKGWWELKVGAERLETAPWKRGFLWFFGLKVKKERKK